MIVEHHLSLWYNSLHLDLLLYATKMAEWSSKCLSSSTYVSAFINSFQTKINALMRYNITVLLMVNLNITEPCFVTRGLL
jgi:hypothetical protein